MGVQIGVARLSYHTYSCLVHKHRPCHGLVMILNLVLTPSLILTQSLILT